MTLAESSNEDSQTDVPEHETAQQLPEDSTVVSFQCCCGKNCSLDTYVGGECRGQLEKSFPFLNLNHLNECNKEKIIRKLLHETMEMIQKFRKFRYSVFKSLKVERKSVDEVVEVALCFGLEGPPKPICDRHSDELSKVTTISGIHSFLIKHAYVSFINYGILKEIVECLGTPLDKKLLEEYLGEFGEYCKRQVFEVPKSVLASPPLTIDPLLVVKVDEQIWFKAKRESDKCIFTANDMYAVEHTIARVINLDHGHILILDVAKGCVQLSFAILSFQTAKLFPITTAQLGELLRFGITILNQPNVSQSNRHTAFSSIRSHIIDIPITGSQFVDIHSQGIQIPSVQPTDVLTADVYRNTHNSDIQTDVQSMDVHTSVHTPDDYISIQTPNFHTSLQNAAVQTADIKSPDVQTADVKIPDVQTVDIKTLDIQYRYPKVTTDVKVPTDIKIADLKNTVIKTADIKSADVQTPDVQTADVQTPDVQTADVQTVDIKIPDVQTTDVKTPDEMLLSQVNGTIFAPEHFKQHHNISSSTGVVPLSEIKKIFPNHNPQMIVGFLTSLEFCHQIGESEASLISRGHLQSSDTQSESYYFFPALVSEERPEESCKSIVQAGHKSGWCLQRIQEDQFLTSRFLHVLLLQLSFRFSLPHNSAETDKSCPVIQRKCSVWKSGIHWLTMDGVEAIVEVVEQSTAVTVVVGCQEGGEMASVQLRSDLIRTVLALKEKYSGAVEVRESLISPSELDSYPLKSPKKLSLFNMESIALAISKEGKFVTRKQDFQQKSINDLLYFEPFSSLGTDILKELFEESNDKKQLDPRFLKRLGKVLQDQVNEFRQTLQVGTQALRDAVCDNPAHYCYLVSTIWKEQGHCSYGDLRSALSKFSVFCGRNPLVSGVHVVSNGYLIMVSIR